MLRFFVIRSDVRGEGIVRRKPHSSVGTGVLDCPSRTNNFYVIYGFYLANKHPQTCRAVARLAPKTVKIDVIYGYNLYSVVGATIGRQSL